MIKAINKEAAIRYAKSLELGPFDYVIFDLGKETLLVCGSKNAITSLAEESAQHFADKIKAFVYDAYENEDEKRLCEKLHMDNAFIQMTAEHLIKMLEQRKIYTTILGG